VTDTGPRAPLSSATSPLAGALVGQALGDALGFVVETNPPVVAERYVREWLRAGRAGERAHAEFPFGQYSDDTQLARAVLLGVRDAGGWRPEAFARRVAELFAAGGDVGAGQGTRSAALRMLAGVSWQEAAMPAPYAGNGSAMRAAPLGLLFADPGAVRAAAREQSLVTHRDPRCAAGAVAVAGAAWLAAKTGPIEPGAFLETLARWTADEERSVGEAVATVATWLELAPDQAVRGLHDSGIDPAYAGEWRGISAFVTPSVAWSLYAFLRSPDDYWETVCTAIQPGGDTDTMAAIAGGLAGARVGVAGLPGALVERVNDRGRWGAPELIALAEGCVGLCR
jgi:ADP-ribosylglycohydrolase